jgi:hypothetical protein
MVIIDDHRGAAVRRAKASKRLTAIMNLRPPGALGVRRASFLLSS